MRHFARERSQTGLKHSAEGIEKTGTKRSGPQQTGRPTPLSGPRYRGSNPCSQPSSERLRTSLESRTSDCVLNSKSRAGVCLAADAVTKSRNFNGFERLARFESRRPFGWPLE
jgi:hypothetical protein